MSSKSTPAEPEPGIPGRKTTGRTLIEDVAAIARIDAVQTILEVICRTTGMGFSAVARVTESRWIACAVRDEIDFGLRPGGELELRTTICDEIRQSGRAVVIDHADEDKLFCGHPTPKKYGFQSYISMPIVLSNGQFFGTLCAIDPRPARLNRPEIIGMFKLFAELIAQHLDAHDRMAHSEAALLDERQTAQLREQFIAVLGHDLRNPLAAIKAAVYVLGTQVRDNEPAELLDIIRRSVTRMAGLIENTLDFARGRLGGGITLTRVCDTNLAAVLEQVVGELQVAWPARMIERDIDLARPVSRDNTRLAQLMSNLLANALAYGDPHSPVRLRGRIQDGYVELSVTNRGETIPPSVIAKLFQPFARGAVRQGQQGLGLGLYIAAEIARAHQGGLTVTSVDGETRFTFRMPERTE